MRFVKAAEQEQNGRDNRSDNKKKSQADLPGRQDFVAEVGQREKMGEVSVQVIAGKHQKRKADQQQEKAD